MTVSVCAAAEDEDDGNSTEVDSDFGMDAPQIIRRCTRLDAPETKLRAGAGNAVITRCIMAVAGGIDR